MMSLEGTSSWGARPPGPASGRPEDRLRGRLEGRTMALQSGTGAGAVPSFRLHNLVLPTLMAAGIAAVLTTGFVTSAPNRLLSGRPIGLFAAADLRLGAAIG